MNVTDSGNTDFYNDADKGTVFKWGSVVPDLLNQVSIGADNHLAHEIGASLQARIWSESSAILT